ncbi:indole-3-glycerol phosphate synthase TrpC [Paenibacillus sp. J22TS3]|uniref:indole-3-glycerol phosphate synthase TrpC n=1 Tax=Paenibacillus sp. J22TS3 TaxID=2807192 RepID=UPI001B194E81|nr:indole-3-glycerol phosphate synthase TrpC [Paenibacillus sp. J22TS3]GIP20100.1 indole-3-glycerol phosphate synthase [Paenibacillus sp. J22TS3]
MYLDRIVATKQKEVEELASSFSLTKAERAISEMPATLGFHQALSVRRKRSMGLIAEVKKASPSKGLIRPDFNPVDIARAYEEAGTDCISVLTDKEYFQGSPEYLKAIRQAVNVPLLRKDFMIDERQIYEARLMGADAILLIAAILTDQQLKQFEAAAEAIGLDALVEVHDREELDRVLSIGTSKLIGINNRNLRTFEVSLGTTAELSSLVPEGITLISESGISKPADISYLASCGAKGVLIGETFMREPVVQEAVNQLIGPVESRSRAAHE